MFSINSGAYKAIVFLTIFKQEYIIFGINDEGCSDNIIIIITEPSLLGLQVDNVGDVCAILH